ncbi:MAG: orotate phosphoribosyltransferase [Thermoanaerobaculales bacterium]
MTTELLLSDLTACGAHQRGHFLLSSGLHSGDYLQCALYLAQPRRAARAGGLIGSGVRAAGLDPELVVAPAMGGLIIGHETARALDLPFLFTERSEGAMVLRRGFGLRPGQRVVVVEDVVTTGRSTREVIEILEDLGAAVIGVASIVNRSGRPDPFAPRPYHALLAAHFPTWTPETCLLCSKGVPIAKPGSRPIA